MKPIGQEGYKKEIVINSALRRSAETENSSKRPTLRNQQATGQHGTHFDRSNTSKELLAVNRVRPAVPAEGAANEMDSVFNPQKNKSGVFP